MRIGIVGSREFGCYFDIEEDEFLPKKSVEHYAVLKTLLAFYIESEGIDTQKITIVSGRAKGADSLGELYARENGFNMDIHKADWGKYGLSAGYKRNPKIVENSDVMFIFWDETSKGTLNTIKLSKKANKKIFIYLYKQSRLYIVKPKGTLDD